MQPQEQPPEELNSHPPDEWENSLAEVERSLVALKQRYLQVKQDRQQQAELQQHLKQVKRELNRQRSPHSKAQLKAELKAELKQIQQQLETIEINLESQLFSWGSLKAPFWQAVRFGGLGVIVGWILKSLTG
jgi:DNA repair ATPase RecN